MTGNRTPKQLLHHQKCDLREVSAAQCNFIDHCEIVHNFRLIFFFNANMRILKRKKPTVSKLLSQKTTSIIFWYGNKPH